MHKIYLLGILVFIMNSFVLSQTNNQKTLQNAILKYNNFRDEIQELQVPVTDEQIAHVEQLSRNIISKLDSIQSPDNDEMRKVISYFRPNTQYEIAFLYGKIGKLKKCHSLMMAIEPEMTKFTSDAFPMNYSYFGTNYSIKFENYKPTLCEFYTALSELSSTQSTENDVLLYGRKALNLITDNEFLRGINHYHMVKAKKKLKVIDKEYADLSLGLIESYSRFSQSELESAQKSKINGDVVGWENLNSILTSNSISLDKAAYYQRAASALSKANSLKNAEDAYKMAISNGSLDRNFLFEAGEFGARNSKELGIQAADKLSQIISNSDCNGWIAIGDLYSKLGEKSKSQTALDQANKCTKAEQKKIARSNRNFHLYLGTYPTRYFTQPSKMDYSGVVGILTGKTMINFSYLQVKKKNYYFPDLWLREKESTDDNWKPKWDGIQADVGLRFCQDRFSKTGSYTYVGPKFGYARKTLSEVETGVTDANGNYSIHKFNPVDEQLQFMIESGVIAYGKTFGIDLNMGFGAFYGTFKTGNEQIKLEENTFDNVLLDNETDTHWGPIIRINITLGIML